MRPLSITILSSSLLLLLVGAPLFAQEPFDTDDPFDESPTTGVPVGEKIPDFDIEDADGRTWNFASLRGPKGAVLHFYRSADW